MLFHFLYRCTSPSLHDPLKLLYTLISQRSKEEQTNHKRVSQVGKDQKKSILYHGLFFGSCLS
uniref:Uncharacterized protein n=1 Tax=Arundo donax TaxID=35708 RepID=A0A0A9H065_ARUDO